MDLTLSTRTEGDRTVVAVAGEIDVYTAPKLREQLIDLVTTGSYHLIVDMEGVDFLDSTGLGVLVGGLKRVRAHDGSLRLVCTQERILKIFRITGLTKVFPIHASVDEAARGDRLSRVDRSRLTVDRGPCRIRPAAWRPSGGGFDAQRKCPRGRNGNRRTAIQRSSEHVRTARLVAAAVARRAGVAESVLDEVRLAVGEACSRAVGLHQRGGSTSPVRVALTDQETAIPRSRSATESGALSDDRRLPARRSDSDEAVGRTTGSASR